MLLRTPLQKQKRSPPAYPVLSEPGFTRAMEGPSPTKRPRAPVKQVEDDAVLSRRAIEVYNDAQRFGGYPSVYLTTLTESELGAVDFEDEAYQLDDGEDVDHDHLDGVVSCTYKCRNMVKSEVLETLDKRENQVMELESAVKSLKAGLAAAEFGEKRLVRGRKSLEQLVAAANGRGASLHAQRLQESEKADEMLRTQLKRCHELQARLQEEMKLKAEAEATARSAEARAMESNEDKRRYQLESAREIGQLNRELSRLRRDSDYTLKRIKAGSANTMEQAQLATEQADSLISQLEEEQKLLAKTVKEKQALEHKVADYMAQLATRTTGPSEADSLIKHLQEELRQRTADVAESRKLKQVHVNAALLKEQLVSERLRADRAEASLVEFANVQLKVEQLESEIQLWCDMVESLPGVHSCDDVPRRIAELQREAVAATAKTGEVAAQVAELQIALDRSRTLKLQAEARALRAQEEHADSVLKLKRVERKVAMVSAERDGLKRILESYDEEEAVIASHRKPGDTVGLLATPEKAKEKRIQEIAEALSEAQQHATQLEEALVKSNDSVTEQRQKVESLTEDVNQALEKVMSLEHENSRLGREVATLESKIGRGEFNPATTKVLHFINNLESGYEIQNNSPSIKEKDKNQSQEVAALLKQIASLEKLRDRYKQIFGDKITLLKKMCYLLFGYKVLMHEEKDSATGIPVNVFTLQSIYAQSDEEKLLFQLNSSGQMDMLANEYTASPELERQVRTFLKNFKSYPAFMANLTMELFNKTTIG